MYGLEDYASMIADRRRVAAYAAALRTAIKPGAVVVEIGTGVGAFAVMAVKMGARRVIAIEPNDAIVVARLVARENGVEDRIDFFHGLAQNARLAEPADVIFADLRGALPVATRYLETMIHARETFLAPGGILIPAVDTLFAAIVTSPGLHHKTCPMCSDGGIEVSLGSLHRHTANRWGHARFKPGDLMTEPRAWATIDYRTLSSADVVGTASFVALRAGTAHGIAVWFDAELADGVGFSNAPGEPDLIWGMAFFPWPQPVLLKQGDAVCLRMRATYVGHNYVWRWDTEVRGSDDSERPKARFSQSDFYAAPLTTQSVKNTAIDFACALDEEGCIERTILQMVDGATSNGHIARELMARFPATFRDLGEAAVRVAGVVRRFGTPPDRDERNPAQARTGSTHERVR
jgi:type I protein arginine methyltransferase